MIDRRKNVCYVIEVPYVEGDRFDTNYKYQKFLSLHSITSKRFVAFQNRYFEEILNIPIQNIGEADKMDTVLGSQRTISIREWQSNADLRREVLEGITEREKCR